MWKKDEPPSSAAGSVSGPTSPSVPPPSPAPSRPPASGGERAIIGPSIAITGEVNGDEDLLIQGRVDGTVNLEQHAVTVGPEGRVKAGINGRVVVVEGSVEGDLRALEQIILRRSARVSGDVTAPRVVLEDGATFRGRIDMGDGAGRAGRRSPAEEARGPAAAKPAPAAETKALAGPPEPAKAAR